MRDDGTAPSGCDGIVPRLLSLVPARRRTELEAPLTDLLDSERRRWLARAEQIWLRRFGWSLMRPLLATGVVTAVVLLAWDRERAGTRLASLLAGAALFYAVLQVYVARWLSRAERRETDARAACEAAEARLPRTTEGEDA